MMHSDYETIAFVEMDEWRKEMRRKPGLFSKLTQLVQQRINKVIPEKAHQLITTAIKHAVEAMLTGSKWIAPKPEQISSLEYREIKVQERINFYKNTAATEGAITGAGGLLLSLADFPIWLSLKMKMLTDIASLYGHNVNELNERIYMLHIFQLAFSSKQHQRDVLHLISDWDNKPVLNDDPKVFDWRKFQQEYRDYIDIAKLLQLIPGIGAIVGAYVNHRLTDKLGKTAMNAYRMRHFQQKVVVSK